MTRRMFMALLAGAPLVPTTRVWRAVPKPVIRVTEEVLIDLTEGLTEGRWVHDPMTQTFTRLWTGAERQEEVTWTKITNGL